MKKKIKHQEQIQRALQQARTCFNSGHLNEAYFICRDVLRVDAGHADALHLFGLVHHRLGDIASAARWIEKAVQAKPRSGVFLTNLGTMRSLLGEVDKAASAYERALVIDPSSAPAHLNLGAIYSRLQRYDDAIAAYRRAIQLNPDYAEAYNNLGMDLERKGLMAEAAEQLRQAVRINPQFQIAYQKLLFFAELLLFLFQRSGLGRASALGRHPRRTRPATPILACAPRRSR